MLLTHLELMQIWNQHSDNLYAAAGAFSGDELNPRSQLTAKNSNSPTVLPPVTVSSEQDERNPEIVIFILILKCNLILPYRHKELLFGKFLSLVEVIL